MSETRFGGVSLLGLFVLLVSGGHALTASAATSSGARGEEGKPAAEIVEDLVSAFNAGDADAMAGMVAEGFELFYVGDDGKPVVGASGREPFREQMKQYFTSFPDVRSRADHMVPGPIYVSYREQIVEGPGAGTSSVAVYEVRDGLIRRAWYYPAESTPSEP